jgi:uncharacterized GH25 family protein
MKKYILSFTLLLLLNFATMAHEFWMQPDKYFYNVGEQAVISFKVGEDFKGEPWSVKKSRIEKLEILHHEKRTDLRAQIAEGNDANLKIPMATEGTHLIVMQSNNALITLDGEKFNAYLKEDGLDEALYHREKTNTLRDSASELYSRYTKLLLQVGGKTDNTYSKVAGLPIEIIPDKNPYALTIGDPIRFQVLFNGKPLFGAKVKVWNHYNNRTALQNIYTQQDGRIDARITTPGSWMVSVVTMVPSKEGKAQWQSYWGSLVFGIK